METQAEMNVRYHNEGQEDGGKEGFSNYDSHGGLVGEIIAKLTGELDSFREAKECYDAGFKNGRNQRNK